MTHTENIPDHSESGGKNKDEPILIDISNEHRRPAFIDPREAMITFRVTPSRKDSAE